MLTTTSKPAPGRTYRMGRPAGPAFTIGLPGPVLPAGICRSRPSVPEVPTGRRAGRISRAAAAQSCSGASDGASLGVGL